MLVAGILRKLVRIGTLTVIDAGGKATRFEGDEDGPSITIRFLDRAIERRLFVNGSLALGEGYMNGSWTVEDASLYEFLEFIGRNLERSGRPRHQEWLRKLLFPVRRFQQHNPATRARRNVAHHYDLSGALYDLFLDADRQYSCAYYVHPNDALDTAQENKKRLIASKLLLRPGQHVLDIGCGWGGLALYLAREYGVDVTGLTLSSEQHAMATKRAEEAGLSDKVRFHLRDYRDQTGHFDRIVSVGMFEHVGVGFYPTYFGKVRDLLTEDGVALIHTIGRMEGPSVTDPWIRKYIFPGGYLPALSEIVKVTERLDLWTTDIEILRMHYAFTLRDWRHRFLARRDEALAQFDERFCRMWEYYLAICEMSFRHLRNTVFQVQLARRQDAVPLTRDYLWNIDFARDHAGDREGAKQSSAA